MNENKKLIFIVDDDEMLSEMLADHLKATMDLETIIFGTGEACLEEIDKNPDLVILDFNLNSIEPFASNGIDILKIIRDRKKDMRVVMHSSQAQQGEALKLVDENTLEYVIKNQEAFYRLSEIIKGLD